MPVETVSNYSLVHKGLNCHILIDRGEKVIATDALNINFLNLENNIEVLAYDASTIEAVSNGILAYMLGHDSFLRESLKSVEELLVWLCGAYITTHATVPCFKKLKKLSIIRKDHELENFLQRKIDEEIGHDKIVLRDIETLGFNPKKSTRLIRPELPKSLAILLSLYARNGDVCKALGYAWVLERISTFNTTLCQEIQTITGNVKFPKTLRIHSSTGQEANHLKDLIIFFEKRSVSDLRLFWNGIEEVSHIFLNSKANYDDYGKLKQLPDCRYELEETHFSYNF